MLADIFHLGTWKNFKEMEDNITLDELYLLHDAAYRKEHRQNKFDAAMQGVDLDEETKHSSFDEVKNKAAAALAGKSEERYVFEDVIGIAFEDDD